MKQKHDGARNCSHSVRNRQLDRLSKKGVVNRFDDLVIIEFEHLDELELYDRLSAERGSVCYGSFDNEFEPFQGFSEEEIRYCKRRREKVTSIVDRKFGLNPIVALERLPLKNFEAPDAPDEESAALAELRNGVLKSGFGFTFVAECRKEIGDGVIQSLLDRLYDKLQFSPYAYVFKCNDTKTCSSAKHCVTKCGDLQLHLQLLVTVGNNRPLPEFVAKYLNCLRISGRITRFEAIIAASAVQSQPCQVLIPASRDLVPPYSLDTSTPNFPEMLDEDSASEPKRNTKKRPPVLVMVDEPSDPISKVPVEHEPEIPAHVLTESCPTPSTSTTSSRKRVRQGDPPPVMILQAQESGEVKLTSRGRRTEASCDNKGSVDRKKKISIVADEIPDGFVYFNCRPSSEPNSCPVDDPKKPVIVMAPYATPDPLPNITHRFRRDPRCGVRTRKRRSPVKSYYKPERRNFNKPIETSCFLRDDYNPQTAAMPSSAEILALGDGVIDLTEDDDEMNQTSKMEDSEAISPTSVMERSIDIKSADGHLHTMTKEKSETSSPTGKLSIERKDVDEKCTREAVDTGSTYTVTQTHSKSQNTPVEPGGSRALLDLTRDGSNDASAICLVNLTGEEDGGTSKIDQNSEKDPASEPEMNPTSDTDSNEEMPRNPSPLPAEPDDPVEVERRSPRPRHEPRQLMHVQRLEGAVVAPELPSLGYVTVYRALHCLILADPSIFPEEIQFDDVKHLGAFLNSRLLESPRFFRKNLLPLEWILVTPGFLRVKNLFPTEAIFWDYNPDSSPLVP